jgi:hypothetical protein
MADDGPDAVEHQQRLYPEVRREKRGKVTVEALRAAL